MARQVLINEENCLGCESCVELCPEIFDFDDVAGKAKVIMPEGGDEMAIEEAISSCPGACISFK